MIETDLPLIIPFDYQICYYMLYRDNQRSGGLYHEIIYETEVVYRINDRGEAEVVYQIKDRSWIDYFMIETSLPLIIPIEYWICLSGPLKMPIYLWLCFQTRVWSRTGWNLQTQGTNLHQMIVYYSQAWHWIWLESPDTGNQLISYVISIDKTDLVGRSLSWNNRPPYIYNLYRQFSYEIFNV